MRDLCKNIFPRIEFEYKNYLEENKFVDNVITKVYIKRVYVINKLLTYFEQNDDALSIC